MTSHTIAVDELHRIIQDTRVAQHDLLEALVRMEESLGDDCNAVLAEAVRLIEPTFCKLNMHLARIAYRVRRIMPPHDPWALSDELVEAEQRRRRKEEEGEET